MKNNKLLLLSLLLLLLFSTNLFSQQFSSKEIKDIFNQIIKRATTETISMLDSAIVTKEDGSKERHLYTYTNASYNQWDNYLWQNWDGSSWNNYMMFSYNYNSNGKLTSAEGGLWNGNSWDNFLRYSITWDGNNITGTLSESWDGTQWVVTEIETMTYDPATNTEVTITESSYFGMNMKTRITDTYDANMNTISTLTEEWDGNQFVNLEFETHTYNSYNNATSDLIKEWGYTNQWENIWQTIYEYDTNQNRISEIFQGWNGVDWENYSKNTITFDSRNYMTMNLTSVWDGSAWSDYWRFTYNYTADGNSFHGLSEIWDGAEWYLAEGEFHIFDTKGYYTDYETFGDSYLFDGTEIDAYYASVTDIKDNNNVTTYSLSQNYPNPFNPSTVISFSIPESHFVSLKVFNILGEEVTQLVSEMKSAGSYSISFNASSLPTGLYIYQISAGDFTATKKMMLIK